MPEPYRSRTFLRLLADVEGVGRLHLHPVCQLHRLDARLQLRVLRALLLVPAVQLLHQIELLSLLLAVEGRVPDVFDQLVDARLAVLT